MQLDDFSRAQLREIVRNLENSSQVHRFCWSIIKLG